jgi:hypothetical protein
MAIDPNEINSIEDSMVHDVDETPQPKGWGIYLTLRFLSKVVLGVYGVMLLGMVVLQILLRGGENMPISLMPQSVLMALPIALVAVYFYFSSELEPELTRKRTAAGRTATFLTVFVLMQAVSVLLWVGIAKAFSLH